MRKTLFALTVIASFFLVAIWGFLLSPGASRTETMPVKQGAAMQIDAQLTDTFIQTATPIPELDGACSDKFFSDDVQENFYSLVSVEIGYQTWKSLFQKDDASINDYIEFIFSNQDEYSIRFAPYSPDTITDNCQITINMTVQYRIGDNKGVEVRHSVITMNIAPSYQSFELIN